MASLTDTTQAGTIPATNTGTDAVSQSVNTTTPIDTTATPDMSQSLTGQPQTAKIPTTTPTTLSSNKGASVITQKIQPVIDQGKTAQKLAADNVTQQQQQQQEAAKTAAASAVPGDIAGTQQTYQDAAGVQYYSDTHQPVPAPDGAVQSANGNWYYNGKAYLEGPQNTQTDAQKVASLYDQLSVANTNATKAIVDSLKAAWASADAAQKQANQYQQGAFTQYGIRSGISRYSPTQNANLISTVMNEGVKKIQAIDTKYTGAIAQAETALQSQNLKVALDAANSAADFHKQAQDALQKQLDAAQKIAQKNQDAARLSSIGTAVGDLVKQGITDPATILDYINNYKDGTSTGANLSAKELKGMLDVVGPDTKALGDIMQTAVNNGAPPNVLQAISSAPDANAAYVAAGNYGAGGTGTVGEYNYAKANGYSGSLLDYVSAKKAATSTSAADGAAIPAASNIDFAQFTAALTPGQQAAFGALPNADKSVVMSLLNGSALLTDIVKSRGAAGTALNKKYLAEAQSVDPSFSVNENKSRYNFMKNWDNPNGKSSMTRNALNTALGHLADFKTNANTLDPSQLQFLNNVNNILSAETGDPKILKIRTDINALASEVATAYKGGQPAVGEIDDWKKTIAADFSKNQFQGVTNEIAQLLSSKITASRYQYKNTMGHPYPKPIIDPEKKAALINAGVSPTIFPTEDTGQPTAPEVVAAMDKANTPVIAKWVASDPKNKEAYDAFKKIAPNASTQDIMDALGISSTPNTQTQQQSTGFPSWMGGLLGINTFGL